MHDYDDLPVETAKEIWDAMRVSDTMYRILNLAYRLGQQCEREHHKETTRAHAGPGARPLLDRDPPPTAEADAAYIWLREGVPLAFTHDVDLDRWTDANAEGARDT